LDLQNRNGVSSFFALMIASRRGES
jgi:hypothetical protein